ncbi:glycolate oxidase subunit GlcE [Aquabacterium sp. A08]|uniref:glycolate oxidase subunit GlcE n=1 Tax=Aquabacterium sp. A08 TaxID=2718532 RepID=UPI00141FEDC6|nr:glycolate oxidase subunit GlcE [Aquabacterium sp. A08]NIC40399.1 glycolate oxidase subunit GlcE [Aquabacterium sp. A08]
MSAETAPTVARWADQIRAAAADGTALRLVGGDSKAFYGPPLPADLPRLETREHGGIVAHEPTELVLTARAGTPLAEVEAALAACGQCLAFEPPHFGPDATVGGMVAAGLSGPARASVGAVRDFVLGVQLLNGRGEHLTFGGQVMKNVAGYDVSRLLAGSLGSLGVITEVSLKVLPVAPAEATLCFELAQDAALAQLARWRGHPLPLNASCWVLDDTGGAPRPLLFVRLRGAAAAVEAACTRMLADAPGERQDTAITAADWRACGEQTLPFFAQPPSPAHGLWRLSVAPTTPVLDLPGPTLVEWFGGLRWVWAPVDAGAALRQVAQAAGGHATLFRAPADAPLAAERFTPPAPALRTIQQRLQREFDPAGVFNPGRWGFGL